MIRALAESDVARLAEGLATLPLMIRYQRTAPALASDLRGALARGEGLLYHERGGLAWFLPSGTLGMGGYLKLIAVTGPTSRKVGSELLQAFEDATAQASRHAFLLVSDFNTDAQRFYERHGYTQVGSMSTLILPDVDERIYWKRLNK